MARLKALPPRLKALPPRLTSPSDSEGHSLVLEPWRRWFWTKSWKDLRLWVLERDGYTCRCGCNTFEPDTSLLVADHIKPHRGDPILFWDPDNLQCLWKPHHDGEKQRQERRGLTG